MKILWWHVTVARTSPRNRELDLLLQNSIRLRSELADANSPLRQMLGKVVRSVAKDAIEEAYEALIMRVEMDKGIPPVLKQLIGDVVNPNGPVLPAAPDSAPEDTKPQ